MITSFVLYLYLALPNGVMTKTNHGDREIFSSMGACQAYLENNKLEEFTLYKFLNRDNMTGFYECQETVIKPVTLN